MASDHTTSASGGDCSFADLQRYSNLGFFFFSLLVIKAICQQRGPITVSKYLLIFQTEPLRWHVSTCWSPNNNSGSLFVCPTALVLLLAAQARLSLEHIEYLYSKRLGSRSLISKVTCWGPVCVCGPEGGCAGGTGFGSWDVLSPQCVLSVFCARRAQRRDGVWSTSRNNKAERSQQTLLTGKVQPSQDKMWSW